jgi:tRNA threonylcarbamoyl adenosine modification protein YjeE
VTSAADPQQIIELPNEAATAAFAEDVASSLRSGDVVGLSGGLGAGKTTFARALVRALADDSALEVPSPTFTLVQTYAAGRLTVAHFDLYRISSPDELDEIGLSDAAADGAVLIEWPERAGDRLPSTDLDIAFVISGDGRRATIAAKLSMAERLARSRASRQLLDQNGWSGASRRHIQGDASTRTYERIALGGRTAVLMDWPLRGQLTVGDPRTAFRARDARAFVAVDAALRDIGLSAPEILAADTGSGLVLLEDFGSDGIVDGGAPVPERYRAVIDALAAIHERVRPRELPLPEGAVHRLPHLSGEALLAVVDIFANWYVPFAAGESLGGDARQELAAIWRALDERLTQTEQSWVLFDVQSPNLLWLAERSGIARVGFIDFQDAFWGPSAYDVSALCQDARVTISAELETELTARYSARRASTGDFDTDSFSAAFAISAALRNFKNMGAFARLASVGNQSYIKHLPRLRAYLARALSHPVLSPLAVWYERHLPP